jgi:ABC-type phosphate transport system substrate-binding protein
MRVRQLVFLVFILLLTEVSEVCADIVVIVNEKNPVTSLSRSQVVDLYMGKRINFPTGEPALPIDQAAGSRLRQQYYQALVGKTEAKINAYWARLLFSGIASPPRVLPTPEAAIQIVRENVAAIAYVDAADADKAIQDKRVKIVFSLVTDSLPDGQ